MTMQQIRLVRRTGRFCEPFAGKGVSPELIREIGEDDVDVRACLERGLTLSAKEMRCHSELRWDRRLEPLSSASVSLRGCCAGKSPIVIIEDDVIYTISFPSSLFLSVLPEKTRDGHEQWRSVPNEAMTKKEERSRASKQAQPSRGGCWVVRQFCDARRHLLDSAVAVVKLHARFMHKPF